MKSQEMLFLGFVILSFSFKITAAITNGRLVESEKRYIVYLLKADESPREYIAWLCGGAIISNWHILTSAACVIDVVNVYVISGYKKYVPIEKMEEDECLKRKKKKIVRTCVPKAFDRDLDKLLGNDKDYWNWADIMVAMVDTPFDFFDNSYFTYCSYPPAAIEVNFLSFHEKPGTNVIAYGWGHAKYQRPINDTRDYNEKYLRYSSGMLTERNRCKSFAPSIFYYINKAFRRFLICMLDYGNLDEKGHEIIPFADIYNDCNHVFRPGSTPNLLQSMKGQPKECMKHILRQDPSVNDPNLVKVPGICQNDHGGPLVTWRGGREVLVGVASTYSTSSLMECRAPYGFTSTHCHNKFIACALWPSRYGSRRFLDCEGSLKQRGYYMVERNISWINHPDGPAENEKPRRSGPRNHGYDRL